MEVFVWVLQQKAVEILKKLKAKSQAVAVKADFEAEGTGLEELVFLSRVVEKAGLLLVVKIGGSEAVFDLKQAKLFGASEIMVPVIESEFALKKFCLAVKRVFGADLNFVNLVLNVETKTCVENLEQILKFGSKFLKRLVIGRVDLSHSLNLNRSEIDSNLVLEECLKIFKLAKKFKISTGLGGGVSAKTYDSFLKRIDFDYFETRKVVFKNENFNQSLFSEAIQMATEFEILCLKFKQEYFNRLAEEDKNRLELLTGRMEELNG